MVKSNPATLDLIFAALADPTRRAMVRRLSEGDCTVSELAEPFDMSLPAVSKHVRVLRRASLLTQDRHGRARLCRLEPAPLRQADDWMQRYRAYWSDQLDALTDYLEQPDRSDA